MPPKEQRRTNPISYGDIVQPRTPALSASRALDRFHSHNSRTVDSNLRRKQLSKNPATDPTLNPLARRPPTTVPRVGEWAIGSSAAAPPQASLPPRPGTALPPGYQQGVRVFPERARVAGSVAARPSRVARARAATASLGRLAPPNVSAPAPAATGLAASASLSQLAFGAEDLSYMTPVHLFRAGNFPTSSRPGPVLSPPQKLA